MSTNSPRGSIPAPTVRGSLSNGFQVFSDDVVPLLVAGFIVVAVQAICASVFVFVEHGMYITAGLYLLVVSPLEFGMAFVCLRAVRSGRVTLEHLIAVTGSYGSVVGAGVILSVASTLTIMSVMQSGSMIIVTVIGCAFLCATRFVPFLVLEDQLGGLDAIFESIRLSREVFLELLVITALGTALMTLLGISILGVAPALIWRNLCTASLYHAIARPPQGWAIEDEEELERRKREIAAEEAEEQAEQEAWEREQREG